MDIIEFLKSIGIETPSFLAGMSGGVTFLTKNSNMSRRQQFLTVLSGGLIANYCTPLVGDFLSLKTQTLYGIAFILGYSGMKLVELVLKSKINTVNGNENK